jgi:hypothetical protein
MPDSTLPIKEEEKELLTWIAPARPFKRRNRDFFVTIGGMAAIVALVLFLIDGFLPVILIISLVFLGYVMATVEPENIEYKITTKGIKIAGKVTEWNIMGRFWFTKRLDNELLIIETRVLPYRLEIVINSEVKDQIKRILSDYLTHEEIPASNLDKAANWFSKKMPGIK